MGKRTKTKLIIRSIIFVVTAVISFFDASILKKVMSMNIIGNIKLYNILWCYLIYEMIIVMMPNLNDYTYSGKLFSRHFNEDINYNREKLRIYTKKNYIRALRAFIFWIGLNSIIAYIYFRFNLSPTYMYLLFLFYYWSDMFCVNVWCPFHKLIVRNKCCNECRIYNWGHIMYLTPLIFIRSVWTYTLVAVGVILFIQWEYLNFKYPERFSPISNKNLRCSICENDCRYNKKKKKTSTTDYDKNESHRQVQKNAN